MFESRNPNTGILNETFSLFSAEDVEKRVAFVHEGYALWHREELAVRKRVVAKIAAILRDEKEKFADIMHNEMGKLLYEGIAEIEKCASLCDYSLAVADEALKSETTELNDARVTIKYESLGIILAVMPWNFPFWQVFRATIPSILAGNTFLMKHATNTPRCAQAIERIFTQAHGGCAILQNLLIDHDQVSRLILDKRIKGVALTGSHRAGVEVGMACASAVKPLVLELGGSDPFIVFADADVHRAVRIGAQSRCINAGQSCIAAKRFIVEASIHDEFISLMEKELSLMQIAPQASLAQQRVLVEQVSDAINKGALLHCGGVVSSTNGFHFPATLLSKVTSTMRVWNEEVFGPVAVISSFTTKEEALIQANDSRYGLGATVFTKSRAIWDWLSEQLESGQVFVNDLVRSDPRFPFGGVKESGFGKELGPLAMRVFTNQKVIWESRNTLST